MVHRLAEQYVVESVETGDEQVSVQHLHICIF
jgi:hypothetical protein